MPDSTMVVTKLGSIEKVWLEWPNRIVKAMDIQPVMNSQTLPFEALSANELAYFERESQGKKMGYSIRVPADAKVDFSEGPARSVESFTVMVTPERVEYMKEIRANA